MEPSIRTSGLTKTYAATTAVRDLSLAVPAGSVFGFLGSNGAGKTTTIRMLLGLVRPTSGSATVLGYDITRERRHIAPRVGAIVDTPCFYSYLGAAENLAALAHGAGQAPSASELQKLLDTVGLARADKRPVKEYSLGMKQRLGIASALVGDPPVLFLDEPTNGLDPDGARDIRDLLSSLRRAGRTIFLSSHLLAEVERICTDVAILQRGILRVQGKISDLLSRSGFEIRVSSIDRATATLALAPRDDARTGPGWVVSTEPEPMIPGVLRQLLLAGIDVFEVRLRRSSLEELFFETSATAQGGAA